jgi:outer membrane translocation and assembly module TamA
MPRTYGTGIRSYLFMDRGRERQAREGGYEIEDNTASITAEQRWRRSRRLEYSWGMAYDYQRSTLRVVTPRTELLTLTGDTVGPRLAVVFDSRDDPFDSRRGFFHSSGLDLGVRFLGSDQTYVRTLFQNFLFASKGSLTFASGLRYGGLFTYGPDSPIQVGLRFDAGGSRSVRGYGEDSLWSEQFLGVPIGGKQMLVFNEEVRFPIWWWLKGAAFVDAGNTFASLGQVRLADLKLGAGWGLRLATPLALIRFDAGYPLDDPNRTKPRYYFSIGQAF